MSDKIVVIGGGQAAASAIMALRQWAFDGDITLIGAEPFPPYQRPPLSKAYMKGELAEERLFIKHAPWYEDQRVELALATAATAIDRETKRVEIEHGGHFDYDDLIIATGSRARKLPIPGIELDNVFDLRTLSDVERIKPTLLDGNRMIIVGAGYIGLEAASAARQMGMNVTVLEYASRVLARVTSPPVSEFFESEHRSQGVDIRTDVRLERLVAENGRLLGAELADGTLIPANVVLIGVGILPNDELADDAGIDCDDGILVDRDARTNDPRIYAAGDCTRRPLVHYDRSERLESVHNAIEQGKLAAACILGRARPIEDCPWFWSDQYDLKLQIAGLSAGYDELVLRGEPDARRFAVFYLKNGKLLATDAINSPAEFIMAKKLILSGTDVDAGVLADTSIAMKDIAAG